VSKTYQVNRFLTMFPDRECKFNVLKRTSSEKMIAVASLTHAQAFIDKL